MEKALPWPEDAGKQPEDWESWSKDAKQAFTKLWETETPEGRQDLLEECKKRGNQQEWEDWLVSVYDISIYSKSLNEEPVLLFGCLPLLSIILAAICTAIFL